MSDSEAKPEYGFVRDPKLGSVQSFAQLHSLGFVPFTLGPVYVYAGIQDDLIKSFAGETQREVLSTTLQFERAVLCRCQEWNYILQVMDLENYRQFKNWMQALQPIDRRQKRFFVVRRFDAPVLDPLLLDQAGQTQPTHLDVFSVSGLESLIKPKDSIQAFASAPREIDLLRLAPEPDVLVLGKAALACVV